MCLTVDNIRIKTRYEGTEAERYDELGFSYGFAVK